MEMSIDEAIEIINHYLDYPKEEVRKALLLAINTMRKYQQIQRIYSDVLENNDGTHFLEDVSEVLDGND